MPRFAFNKNNKDSTSTSDDVESPIMRSSPRRTARSTPESKLKQKPISILKSKRYGIAVQPDSDNDDEFPSDSPFFKAAQEPLTQEGRNESSNYSDESDGEKGEEVVKVSQKQRKKISELEALKKKYTEDLAAGIQTPEVLRGGSTADTSATDDSAEWARKTYANAHKVNKNSLLMSPSELSPASTIAATPASQKSDIMASSTRRTILDEVIEDDEFGMHDDDVSEDDAPLGSSLTEQEHAASIMESSMPPDNFEESENDDNEGEGFQLNSEAPVESDEDHRNQKKKKKNKHSFVTPDIRDGGKKRGRPKKVTISSNAFNVGHQVGNRDYIQVPVDELDGNSSDDEEGTRRSKRKRIAPLAFWKNERPLYTANNATGKLAEVFGDMPFVSGVQKALPTPYKKRTVTVKKKTDDSDSDGDSEPKDKKRYKSKNNEISAEVEEFDASEIKKKYTISNGVTAFVWDEVHELAVDMSKTIAPAMLHCNVRFEFTLTKPLSFENRDFLL